MGRKFGQVFGEGRQAGCGRGRKVVRWLLAIHFLNRIWMGDVMKQRKFSGVAAMFVAVFSMLVVPPVLAGEQLQSSSGYGAVSKFKTPTVVRDVELDRDGVLRGQVLDTQANGVAEAPVVVAIGDREMARVVADADGRFQVDGLRGNTYRVVTPGGEAACRVWAPGTSPPGADRLVGLTVSADPVVRAQFGGGGFWGFVSNPWVSAALITAAIAIPIAISNDSGS